jgi:hypothetical protein
MCSRYLLDLHHPVPPVRGGKGVLIPTGSFVSTNGHGANGGSSFAQRFTIGSHFGQQSTNGLLLSQKCGNDGQTLAIVSDDLVIKAGASATTADVPRPTYL